MSEVILSVTNLSKRFGGVTATDQVNLTVTAGETHALIGPNGAGKTTLISQLSGLLKPDQGSIVFKGNDITGLPAHRYCEAGLARSFQITSVFQDFSLLDNIALAVQANQGHAFRFWANARMDLALRDTAGKWLDMVNLSDRADWLASEVSHGERRQLEIAMALATEPSLLLLDEPMAGMGQEESSEMIDILKSLRGDKSILLVEHDMDAVFALADRISVLVYGKVIASGSPDEIRSNSDVQRAYLGEAA